MLTKWQTTMRLHKFFFDIFLCFCFNGLTWDNVDQHHNIIRFLQRWYMSVFASYLIKCHRCRLVSTVTNNGSETPERSPSAYIIIIFISRPLPIRIWDEPLCGIGAIKYLAETSLFLNVRSSVAGQMSHTCSFVDAEWQSDVGGAAVAHLSLTDFAAATDSDGEQGETVWYRDTARTSRAMFHLVVLFSCVLPINLINCGHLFNGRTFWTRNPSGKPSKVFANKCALWEKNSCVCQLNY